MGEKLAVVVTGGTGKQGGAVVKSLFPSGGVSATIGWAGGMNRATGRCGAMVQAHVAAAASRMLAALTAN
jgi:hypothetical protein